jgi:peptidoglycan/xylan/chitin deacetylase (PgdA/CDA1 family)
MAKFIKNSGLQLLLLCRIHRLFAYLNRNKALILMYHGFTDKTNYNGFENIENIHLDINKFEEQIKYLTSHYNVISIETLLDCFQEKKPFPPCSVVITIDDGYESNYKLAFEILKKYNCPAIIFLTTDFINESKILWTDRLAIVIKKLPSKEFVFHNNGDTINEKVENLKEKIGLYKKLKKILKNVDQIKRDSIIEQIIEQYSVKVEYSDFSEMNLPLNWQQIREMDQSNLITFGGHTCSHFILGKLSGELARKEVIISKKIIEEKTAKECRVFCYPNGQPGDYNETTKRILNESGYICGLTTVQNFVTEKSDIFELERVYVSNRDNLQQFIMSLSGLRFENRFKFFN